MDIKTSLYEKSPEFVATTKELGAQYIDLLNQETESHLAQLSITDNWILR